MQPSYLSLVQVFGAPARYAVPLFQRPYVWNRDEQWEPLWDDIEHLADRVLSAEKGKPIAGHFLGTVVFEQTMTATGTIACREIIDGQQRLTTLQILLKAAEHVLTESEYSALLRKDDAIAKDARVAAQQIAILTGNTAYSEDEEKYKVWPTNDDRDAFCQVMDSSGNGPPALGALIFQAYHYFRGCIRLWLNETPFTAARARALGTALQTHVRLIVLDLEDIDEPQAIFETLNAHGTPLLPADLIKNWLLWEASRQGLKNIEGLYNSWWRAFDLDPKYWRTNVGTGHAARPRVDTFLQNWLTRRTRNSIAAKHLYDRFLQHTEPRQGGGTPIVCDVAALMADIYHDGERYREIEQPTGSTRFDIFLRRLAKIGIAVFHPVLLTLMGRTGSDSGDRDASAVALESYLVRRIVCSAETRGYNEVMLNLLTAIDELEPAAPAAKTIEKTLAGQSAQAYHWPDDEKFRTAWISNRFYGGYRRPRVLMILQALEEHYLRAGEKGEPIITFDFSKLEIEHIMPQEGEKYWELPSSENALIERERRLHGIGNLTLVTEKLNPTLSNASWLDGPNGKKGKRSALDMHSKLQLNARLAKGWPNAWSESTIDKRASDLFEAARQIWPPPQAHS
jgi:hypothetical protein